MRQAQAKKLPARGRRALKDEELLKLAIAVVKIVEDDNLEFVAQVAIVFEMLKQAQEARLAGH